MFKLKKFQQQKSILKNAIQNNELDEVNWCYTVAGHAYNIAEAERIILDKMGPSNQPKKSILTLAAKSVLSKRDRDLMEEESKLLEKYYQDYYNPSKNGSNRSRGSSTDSKQEHKKVGFKI